MVWKGREGHLDYGIHLEKIMNAQVFYPHAAWSGKRVKLPDQESRERKVRGSRRGKRRGTELRLFCNCGGRMTISRFWAGS